MRRRVRGDGTDGGRKVGVRQHSETPHVGLGSVDRPRAAEQDPGGLVPVRHWRQRCQLFHLWRRVTEAVPECSAGRMPLVWADLRLVRQDKVRLQRGVIEIRDATLTREWVTPTQLATLAEQVTVSGGLTGGKAAPHSGCPRTRPRAPKRAGMARSPDILDIASGGGSDIDGELRWLMLVRRAYRAAPAEPEKTSSAAR